MTDQGEALDETFTARLARFLKAWLVPWGALFAAFLVAFAGMTLVYAFYRQPDWLAGLGGSILISVPFGLVFSILGLPLLLLRRWIITPNAPYVGPGYLGVAIYGPVLLAMIGFAENREGFLTAMALYFAEDPEAVVLLVVYELIAFLATMFFARIWRSLGMFEVDAAARARRKGLRRKT